MNLSTTRTLWIWIPYWNCSISWIVTTVETEYCYSWPTDDCFDIAQLWNCFALRQAINTSWWMQFKSQLKYLRYDVRHDSEGWICPANELHALNTCRFKDLLIMVRRTPCHTVLVLVLMLLISKHCKVWPVWLALCLESNLLSQYINM